MELSFLKKKGFKFLLTEIEWQDQVLVICSLAAQREVLAVTCLFHIAMPDEVWSFVNSCLLGFPSTSRQVEENTPNRACYLLMP